MSEDFEEYKQKDEYIILHNILNIKMQNNDSNIINIIMKYSFCSEYCLKICCDTVCEECNKCFSICECDFCDNCDEIPSKCSCLCGGYFEFSNGNIRINYL